MDTTAKQVSNLTDKSAPVADVKSEFFGSFGSLAFVVGAVLTTPSDVAQIAVAVKDVSSDVVLETYDSAASRNERRLALIYKRLNSALSAEEIFELEVLQKEAVAQRDILFAEKLRKLEEFARNTPNAHG